MAPSLKLLICLLLVAFGVHRAAGATDPPPVITDPPPVTTEAPPVTTEAPPVTTEAPPVTTEAPPVTTEAPPVTTEAPPVTTEAPPVTTEAPPVTTEAPPVTTEAPPVTTEAPPVTTEAPPVTTEAPPVTTEAPPVTTEAPPVTTEAPPVTTGGSTTTPTVPQGSCDPNPCEDGSTCQQRADKTYICLCETGDVYDYEGKECISAKVFPGDIETDLPYHTDMKDTDSVEFKKAAETIVRELAEVYKNYAEKKYKSSIVLKLSEASARAAGDVIATVDIIFELSSPVTSDDVKKDVASVGALAVTALCPSKPCDVTTTDCEDTTSGRGFTCTCQKEYVASPYSDLLCVACPNGKQAVDGNCNPCALGYTGFNCEDNWQMILMIVGSVLGAFLVIAIIVLPVVVVNSKKKLKKAKATDYEKSYSNSTKTPQVSNGLAGPKPVKAAPSSGLSGFGGNGVPRIPRAVTNDNSWDRNTNLEMVPSNSRQNLLPRNSRRFDDHEDSNPYSRPMKPQNNPYGGGRPQTNPYASNQGHSNPYYRH